MKIISRALVVYGGFFLCWFLLAQLDYVSYFEIEQKKVFAEKSLGDIIWSEMEQSEEVLYDDELLKTLDSLLLPLCEANAIERDSLKVHLVKNSQINAFAMPDNHLVVYTGLIEASKSEQALLGVLGHEIAHIEQNHVMKKLSKEIGFSVLLSLATGANSGQLGQVVNTLTSSAYDRRLEREADMVSVNYLLKAKIDPRPFADFMYELSLDNEMHKYTYLLTTHPESEDRAKYMLNYLKGKKIESKMILSKDAFENFKQKIKAN
jgi:predicted Zn-dependent protease